MSDTVIVSIVGLIVTSGVALMSQYIAARTALKAKTIELVYARKVDAYKLLLEKAGEFNADPKNHQIYHFSERLTRGHRRFFRRSI